MVRTTLEDVARQAGVSLATVDRVLNRRPGVHAQTAERVQAAVSENLRALRAMRDVNERVMRAVVSALDEKRSSVTGYDARGSLRKGRRTAAAEPAAVQQRA